MLDVPPSLLPLLDALASSRGAVAVVLGGSRASGAATASSDWDIGVYYRGDLDVAPLARFGEVHPPGAWGRIMNGGAWLSIDGAKVDVLFRDLDRVDEFCARARRGSFDVDALLGYVAGVPTYMLMAERAAARTLRGDLPPVGDYPEALAEAAAPRWRFCADFSFAYAKMQAERGNVAGAVGQVVKALYEEAHGRVAGARRWVLNEKHLLAAAGLSSADDWFRAVPTEPESLGAWVDQARASLRKSL
jgi:hypothetical protein